MNVRHDMITVFIARPTGDQVSHEFLQLRRVASSYMGGTWQTVRGKLKPGESAVQAALRELCEETRLVPREFYKLSQLEMFYTIPDETIWHNPTFFALVSLDVQIVLNHEHDAHRWVPVEKVDASFMWPFERLLIDEIRREILGGTLLKPHLLVQMDSRT